MEGSHSGLVRHLGKVVWGKPHQEFKSLTLRQFTISEVSEVLRTCGAVASPAGEDEMAEFATICHAPRGKKEMFWFLEKRLYTKYLFGDKQTPLEVLSKSEYYVSKLPAECKSGWGYAVF